MKKPALIILVLITLFYWKQNKDLNYKVQDMQNKIFDLEEERDSCNDMLEEANSNIEDAQIWAWGSYDDMGYALENLETVN